MLAVPEGGAERGDGIERHVGRQANEGASAPSTRAALTAGPRSREAGAMRRLLFAMALLAGTLTTASAPAADWDPQAFADESTLELRTTGREEGEHWSTVWLVVLDGKVYVRLGTRAAGRIEGNTTAPDVGVRVKGQQFDRVKAVAAPEYAGRVAEAMAAKYWGDVFARQFSHPLTMRLEPEAAGPE